MSAVRAERSETRWCVHSLGGTQSLSADGRRPDAPFRLRCGEEGGPSTGTRNCGPRERRPHEVRLHERRLHERRLHKRRLHKRRLHKRRLHKRRLHKRRCEKGRRALRARQSAFETAFMPSTRLPLPTRFPLHMRFPLHTRFPPFTRSALSEQSLMALPATGLGRRRAARGSQWRLERPQRHLGRMLPD